MFPELNTLCNISPNDPPLSTCFLVEGNSLDSPFIAHHFLSTYLRAGHRVCLLALAQSFNHYNSVGNKLGISLAKARESGQFIFIEGLKQLGEQIISKTKDTNDISGTEITNSSCVSDLEIDYDNCNHSSLKTIYSYCVAQMNQWNQTGGNVPYLFVIDDVSLFSLLGVDSLDVIYFLMTLRSFILRDGHGSLLLQIDTVQDKSETDEQLNSICQHIHHQSDLIFTVNTLQTGYSKDVHGEITVQNKLQKTGEQPIVTKHMQFKICDKSVNFFPLGMSSAVL